MTGLQNGSDHPNEFGPGGPRVLVVEDNRVNQTVAVEFLEKFGYRADVAHNGREAIEAVARQPYAAVFMDCQMPELDGFAATRQIREWESRQQPTPDKLRGQRIPIIAMTASTTPGDRERCLEAGMDDYLPKPVRAEHLQAVLQRWIPGSWTATETPQNNAQNAIPEPAVEQAMTGGNYNSRR